MTNPINIRHIAAVLFSVMLISQYSFAVARPLTTNTFVASPMPEKVESPLLKAGNYKSLFMSSLPKGTRVPKSGPSRRTNSKNN
ncbi:hypothetical protein HanIR_Chr09g0413381 [Helianthus annuus]|nr:hypothetical protein HanIR_Chr09g0413381 [Helianthus annuus]